MGGGTYSSSSRSIRANNLGYATKSREEIFVSRKMNNSMNPKGIKVRESRDSNEHPDSFAIILALDVTGSMGTVPHYLVKEGLPKIVQNIIDNGVADPQILFLGIGDHKCDQAPLQVGQFESSDELMDKWLTDIYLEGGGGGNGGESYLLAWYFAANYTSIDCLEKRGKKGVLITIGDEPLHKFVRSLDLKDIMGQGEYSDCDAPSLLSKAKEMYNVHHISIVGETSQGGNRRTVEDWKEILGNNLHVVNKKEGVIEEIAGIVVSSFSNTGTVNVNSEASVYEKPTEQHTVEDSSDVMLL